jgi:hypothetical protein
MHLSEGCQVEVATRPLLGAIDTGDGMTDEQRGVRARFGVPPLDAALLPNPA